MRVEVVQALSGAQHCVALDVPDGATVADAIVASGLDAAGIDDEHVGIWNRRVTLATVLREADRVELYRSLVADPKLARRVRAERHPVGVQPKRRINRS
jgi:hypothetical protein